MTHATVEEVLMNLPALLAAVGAGEVVAITQGGETVGHLTGPALPRGVPIYGRGKGTVIQMIDDDDHVQDFAGRV